MDNYLLVFTIDSTTDAVYNGDMQEDTLHLTIEELAEKVDTPVRTVRYYITEGLLPGPAGRGKATTYSEEHLQRLRLIRLLANQHRPLVEIHQLLNHLSLAEIRVLLADEEQRAKELEAADQPPPPREYIANLLKSAQINRQRTSQAPSVPPAPQPASPAAHRVYESPGSYGSSTPPVAETWRRWELAPGVELSVKEEAEEQQRALLERLWKAAGIPLQRFHK